MEHLYSEKEISKLPVYERVAATLLMITILIFTAVNSYFEEAVLPEKGEEVRHLTSAYIEVTISGAVEKPGVYQVQKGSLVREIIFQAEPLDTANLKSIKMDSKIVRKRKIVVRELNNSRRKSLSHKGRKD